jgi:DnaJ like chaperone protein
MSASEIVIAVLGVVVGYWVVANLIRPKAPPPTAASEAERADARSPFAAEMPGALLWHQTLAVSPSATADEIKAAYRALMSQYHPDKVASLGVELQVLAERKSKEISAAYREALRARGIDP